MLETCHAYLRGDDVENVGLWDGAASRGEWLVDAVDVGAETAASEKNFIPIGKCIFVRVYGNRLGVHLLMLILQFTQRSTGMDGVCITMHRAISGIRIR